MKIPSSVSRRSGWRSMRNTRTASAPSFDVSVTSESLAQAVGGTADSAGRGFGYSTWMRIVCESSVSAAVSTSRRSGGEGVGGGVGSFSSCILSAFTIKTIPLVWFLINKSRKFFGYQIALQGSVRSARSPQLMGWAKWSHSSARLPHPQCQTVLYWIGNASHWSIQKTKRIVRWVRKVPTTVFIGVVIVLATLENGRQWTSHFRLRTTPPRRQQLARLVVTNVRRVGNNSAVVVSPAGRFNSRRRRWRWRRSGCRRIELFGAFGHQLPPVKLIQSRQRGTRKTAEATALTAHVWRHPVLKSVGVKPMRKIRRGQTSFNWAHLRPRPKRTVSLSTGPWTGWGCRLSAYRFDGGISRVWCGIGHLLWRCLHCHPFSIFRPVNCWASKWTWKSNR